METDGQTMDKMMEHHGKSWEEQWFPVKNRKDACFAS